MEEIYSQFIPIDMFLAVISVSTCMLRKCTLLGLVIAHDCRKGSTVISTNHGQIDTWIFPHLFQKKGALCIMTNKFRGNQVKVWVQSSKVCNGSVHSAPVELWIPSVIWVVRFASPSLKGIGNIHNHITSTANTPFHYS